ncbi:MAG TPA: primase-like DNA-binding domain-containing protein, partial [Candidatus Sericytochromatia bacterium]
LETVGTTIKQYSQVDTLNPEHIEHLYDEGFSFCQIALWVGQGLKSLMQEQAAELGFKVKGKNDQWTSGSGLYFPFKGKFGQLRLDIPIERKKGSIAKYLTPVGAKTQARIPANCKVVTEGAKDAAAGSLHGKIQTGAIAGISHYRKALEQGAGYTILFDADGWNNPNVFVNLFHAGKWLNGKVQIIPEIEGYPKAGLCEYFKAGNTAEDYRELVDSAKKPEALLLEWGKHFGDIPETKLSQAVRVALRLAAQYLDEVQQDILISNIKAACDKVSNKTLNRELKKQQALVEARRKKQEAEFQQEEPEKDNHPEAFYREVCHAQGLDFNNCVTAQTFDGWVYRTEFGATEGDWQVIDSAFYQWREHLGYWQHQPDNRLNSLIADSGDKAFKLKHSKEFGWQVFKPYETNSYKESAFKYCRSRLERPEPLPVNNHLRAFKNCVVDLRTGAQMPHDKEYYLTSQIPYEYEPEKECPEAFRQFVADSFGLDMLDVIQAFTSMFLDPTAPYGRFPHLIGQSGGGKGTLGRFWNSLFGEDGASSGNFSDIATAEGRHQYLTGKSLFSIPDAGGYISGLRAFYELVDNGGMSGRALFNPVGYFKTWNIRFWIASVDHLQIENAGDGWARRAYPIPVRARTVKPDPDLRLKLEACKADVISWALAMPREERDRILLSPPENERVINLSLDSALYGDSTKSFVDLCLRPSANASFVPHHLLHTWYVAYCQQHGYTPLGMSKFISHLKTVLPRNFADRGWSPMVNGKRSRVAAHWEYLAPVEGAFVKSDVQLQPGAFRAPTPADNPVWICIKSECQEGGLMEFEDFWNPPQPPNANCDNNSSNVNTPQSPSRSLLSQENAESGSTVQGGSIFAESLEQRNSGGVQGGSIVQGIGLDLEKNKISILEKPFLEKPPEETLTSVLEGGQSDCRVDSYKLTQSKANCCDDPDYTSYPHLTSDTLEAKRNQAENIKERLLKAQTKQDLTLIREEYTGRCDWVWKNLLTKAQRRTLKDMAAIEQLNLLATSQAISTPETQQDDWLSEENISGIARDLNNCEDRETLQLLRRDWHPEAMNAACKLLSFEKHSEINGWVVELNQMKSQE